MSAIFDFSSLVTVFVLSICTTTYLRELRPAIFDDMSIATTTSNLQQPDSATDTTTAALKSSQPPIRHQPHHHRDGMMGFLWKLSRIGERCSPYISIACVLQALNILFWK
jgi:Protein of unknown function (DUF1242)